MKRLRIIAAAMVLLLFQNVKAQDTVQYRHTIYARLPTAPVTNKFYSGDKFYNFTKGFRLFVAPLHLTYGYSAKPRGEWLGHFIYYHNVVQAESQVYPVDHTSRRLMLRGEKRWFLNPNGIVKPYGGVLAGLSGSYVKVPGNGIDESYYYEGYTATSASFQMGIALGVKIKYKRFNTVIYYCRNHNIAAKYKIGSSTDSQYFKHHTETIGLQVGVSF